jgi:four helix bundle protein
MEDRNKLKQEFKLRMYKYIIRLLKFLVKLPNNPVIQEIKRQLTRSGTSMGANYFEAEAASSKKDFQNYFHISLKSANESKFWLAVLRDSNLCPKNLLPELEYLLQETKEIANIIAKSLITMKNNKK